MGVAEQDVAVALQPANRAPFRPVALQLVTVAHGLELYDVGPCERFSPAIVDDGAQDLGVPAFRVDHEHLAAAEVQLGRKAVVKAVWTIDKQLARVSTQFSYLQHLRPVNAKSAWKQFEKARFERPPEFHYRPLPVDPDLLKRELFNIRMGNVEDPTLQQLFREKRNELELKLTMLRDRDTPRFLPESLQLFGGVEDGLLQRAKELLAIKQPAGNTVRKESKKVDALAFAKRAEVEFAFYRKQFPGFVATTEISAEASGLLVARGRLIIDSDLSLAPSRVDALIAHEIGTHLLTYYNGWAQPFQQLYTGLAGYEELQEGLAVLSEHLVGGLSYTRLQELAARVVAVWQLVDGATFTETFRTLCRDFGLRNRRAYNITMRVYRGGGLTKDAIYLRGLEQILKYVQKGGDVDLLFVGKVAAEHIPLIKELQYRKVLMPSPIAPRHMKDPGTIDRIGLLRAGKGSVADLVSNPREERFEK